MKSTNGQLIWKQIQDLIDNKHVFPAQVNHNNFIFYGVLGRFLSRRSNKSRISYSLIRTLVLLKMC